jgi:DNA modification methylase
MIKHQGGKGGADHPHIAEGLRHLAVPISTLVPDAANARRHGPRNMEAIKASLARWGQRQPIVVQRTGNIVRAGNGRVEAAKALGWTHIAAVVVDDESADAVAYAIADNRTAELAEWDSETLATLLDTLPPEMKVDTGFTDADLAELLDGLTPEITEDEVPEPPKVPVSRAGDLWVLGDHRVLCGDSTKAEDVARLMDGSKADMVLTDPPYGMNLNTDYSAIKGSSKSPNAAGYKYERVIGDDRPFNRNAIKIEAQEEIWFGADYYRETLPSGGSWSVWIKRGEADKDMIGNDIELIWSKVAHKRKAHWIRWVGWDATERNETRSHPTQKPIRLMVSIATDISGDIVVDPFLGSGTTLIAAEQLGRKCYGIEISPQYMDVIVTRWQNLTGKQATLEGKTWDEVKTERGAA